MSPPPPPPPPRPDTDAVPGPRPLLIGARTSVDGGGKGITFATYAPDTGRITADGVVTGVPDPSFPAVAPDGRTVYAVNERTNGEVAAVGLADRAVPGRRGSGGAAPCRVSAHPSGRRLLSAPYGSGSVAVHRLKESGAIGERTDW